MDRNTFLQLRYLLIKPGFHILHNNITKPCNLSRLRVIARTLRSDPCKNCGIVCSQTSCAVLFHCFTYCMCAWESTLFV